MITKGALSLSGSVPWQDDSLFLSIKSKTRIREESFKKRIEGNFSIIIIVVKSLRT